MDFLSLETSKGGFENILVITDYFTRFAQAIPTRNQTSATIAKALFESFCGSLRFPFQDCIAIKVGILSRPLSGSSDGLLM